MRSWLRRADGTRSGLAIKSSISIGLPRIVRNAA
jgi:hypothetical protein